MKKILIFTSSVDYTVDYIINKYSKQYIFYRINVDRFDKYEFNVSFNGGFTIKSRQWEIKENEIYSIYYRKPMLPKLSEYNEIYHNMIARDIISYITGIVDAFDGKVLSRPSVLKKTENKVYQIKIAKRVGFGFPESSIGTSLENINQIICGEGIIKPLTTGKVINGNKCEIIQTSKIDREIEEDISLTPLYVQEYIKKSYEVRITIINNKVFPVKIKAFNSVDWRVDQIKNEYDLIKIPKDIEYKCLEMMEIMGLSFGAFDFIVNEDNDYIFLEINPNGQWLWLEQKNGLNISHEIISYLGE
ncbi:MAG: hypothetical protein E6726_08255 [Clostridium sp.]|uniref:hypothetical protein n=1 Tax=Clostridium sp. TaxID=1506 RepID=UPI0028FFFE8F|nr:hypothetical protein [Clostridium sp.]MDU1978385.1 hypothetical protein [Clostridium sp.]MDU1994817.1 hypothetical protein [Clostridium sp.]MDU6048476.1 hypothetical protein [Clostridium sp.]MDU6222531.1 hypothetical protein [Clostridium sp.]MDU6272570.1 hypothetical protein [Clostridium sp.]